MEWTWDERKAAANWRKHRVLFETATLVFADEYRLTVPDPHADADRWRTIGMAGGGTLFVVHTEADGDEPGRSSARGELCQRRGRYMRRYVSKGITPEIAANLRVIAAMGDEDIDLSGIPEVTD